MDNKPQKLFRLEPRQKPEKHMVIDTGFGQLGALM